MARREYTEFQGFKQINITPLMDLTFLLLIVFMITAPMLEYTVDVTPPKMEAVQPEQKEPLVVNLTGKGSLIVEGRQVSFEDLEQLFQQKLAVEAPTPRAVLIRGDKNRPYKEIITIMKAARNAGCDDINLVTRPEAPGQGESP